MLDQKSYMKVQELNKLQVNQEAAKFLKQEKEYPQPA